MSRGTRTLLLGLCGLAGIGTAVGLFALTREPKDPADVKIIAHGEPIDLDAHAARGKYTVFDFYAPWCPPCRVLGPALERLAKRRPADLAIRKIDIVDWTMPVAAQHGIESLPYLVLYDTQGRKMAQGDDVFGALKRLFGDAAREVTEASGGDTSQSPAAGGGAGRGMPAGS